MATTINLQRPEDAELSRKQIELGELQSRLADVELQLLTLRLELVLGCVGAFGCMRRNKWRQKATEKGADPRREENSEEDKMDRTRTIIDPCPIPSRVRGRWLQQGRDLQTDCRNALKFGRMEANASEMYDAGYCYGFLSGVADTLMLSEKIPAIENVPPDELGRALLKYFELHPEVLSLSAATAVRMAFRQEYEKSQSR